MVELLLTEKVDRAIAGKSGKTPLDLANNNSKDWKLRQSNKVFNP